MNNQRLIIYEFSELVNIFRELGDLIKFDIIEIYHSDLTSLELFQKNDYLIITQNELINFNNQLILKNIPIKISKLIEMINIEFLKINFSYQSEIDVGTYKINLNSREIYSKIDKLKLTEKETDIILYLFNAKKPIKIDILQSKVWGHQFELETHTVETHIYRLRKKFLNKFSDKNFIISTLNGYQIK